MSEINCVYCNNKFSNENNLHVHEKSAKYCIKLRDNDKKENNEIEEKNSNTKEKENKISNKFECTYRKVIFTRKHHLNNHLNICVKKNLSNQELEFNKKLSEQESEFNKKLSEQESEFNKKLSEQESEFNKKLNSNNNDKHIKLLKTTENVNRYSRKTYMIQIKYHENNTKLLLEKINMLEDIISDMKNSNPQNNKVNNIRINKSNKLKYFSLDPINLSIDKITLVFNENVFQKSKDELIDDCINFLLKDEYGTYKYLCFDYDRKRFGYLYNGNIAIDRKLERLINLLEEATKDTKEKLLINFYDKLDKDLIYSDRDQGALFYTKIIDAANLLRFDNEFIKCMAIKLETHHPNVQNSMTNIDQKNKTNIN